MKNPHLSSDMSTGSYLKHFIQLVQFHLARDRTWSWFSLWVSSHLLSQVLSMQRSSSSTLSPSQMSELLSLSLKAEPSHPAERLLSAACTCSLLLSVITHNSIDNQRWEIDGPENWELHSTAWLSLQLVCFHTSAFLCTAAAVTSLNVQRGFL